VVAKPRAGGFDVSRQHNDGMAGFDQLGAQSLANESTAACYNDSHDDALLKVLDLLGYRKYEQTI
jgi:hypothetical protein